MDVKDLKRLMDAMKVAGVAELELEWDGSEERPGGRVVLRREPPCAAAAAPEGGPVATAATADGAPGGALAPPAAEGGGPSRSPLGTEVVAPIVGTFFAAPSPDAPDFVRLGDRVKPGQVLGIIEAMKLMNEIEAEVDGTVVEVLVRDEDPVEFGQVLFRIAPA